MAVQNSQAGAGPRLWAAKHQSSQARRIIKNRRRRSFSPMQEMVVEAKNNPG